MNEAEFWAALAPVESLPVEYRLYHNEQGDPLFFSMEDLPGNYIVVDRETYVSASPNLRVVKGKLKILNLIYKLKPGTEGTPCHPQDVAVIVDKESAHTLWSLQSNETN